MDTRQNALMIRINSDLSETSILTLGEAVKGKVGPFHVKQDLFLTPHWWRTFARLKKMGHDVFWDQRIFDVPNTVCCAAAALGELGVWGFSVSSDLPPKTRRSVYNCRGFDRRPELFVCNPNTTTGFSDTNGLLYDSKDIGNARDHFPSGIIIASIDFDYDNYEEPARLISAGADYVSIGIDQHFSSDGPFGARHVDEMNKKIARMTGAANSV